MYLAEFIGTFVLVLFACGTAAVVGCSSENGTGYLLTALSFGLVIVAMAYSIGNVSGCNINPAVSLAMLLSKKMSVKDFIGYVVAQVLGAIFGSLILGILLGGFDSLGANGFGAVGQFAENAGIALLVEVILTFIFVTVILGVTSKSKYSNVAGIVIGLTLVLVHLIGIPFTGTSVNPARSLAPALFQGKEALTQVWLFIIAPLGGAALASLFYKYVLED